MLSQLDRFKLNLEKNYKLSS